MTIEPTCAPSSLGARTMKEREAWVLPFSRRDAVKFFRSTRTTDSSTLVAARPVRKCAKRKALTTKRSTTDARRTSFLAPPPVLAVSTIASTTLGTLDVPGPQLVTWNSNPAKWLRASNPANRTFLQSPSLSQKLAKEYARMGSIHPCLLVPFGPRWRIPSNLSTAGKPAALDAP